MVEGRDLWVKIMGQSRTDGVNNLVPPSRRAGAELPAGLGGCEYQCMRSSFYLEY
jgi:hypothetical protein